MNTIKSVKSVTNGRDEFGSKIKSIRMILAQCIHWGLNWDTKQTIAMIFGIIPSLYVQTNSTKICNINITWQTNSNLDVEDV